MLAATLDLPKLFPSSPSKNTSMPFFNSVFLIKRAFKNPATDQAKNVDIEFKRISFTPFVPRVVGSRTFLMPNATLMLATQAAI